MPTNKLQRQPRLSSTMSTSPTASGLAEGEVVCRVDNDRKQSQRGRKDDHFHQFVCLVVNTTFFNGLIMGTILLNCITIALETTSLRTTIPLFFISTDAIFLGMFVIEFVMKVYAQPVEYWKNYYNLFDFAILVVSLIHEVLLGVELGGSGVTFLRMAAALRAMRTLRFISFLKGLQVLVTALIETFRSSVLYLLLLLLILMFLFGIMGYYFFGYDERGDRKNWGTLGTAFFSLFTYVTADGWTKLQDELSSHGFSGSEFFTIAFLFLGHFIFTNLFIGVIIMNIHSATRDFEEGQREEKQKFIQSKKEAMIKKQHEDVVQLLETQRASNFTNFHEMTSEFRKTLRHNDFTITTDLCASITWMETMMGSLLHLQNSKHRMQQLHFELAETLTEMKELQLSTESESGSHEQR